VDDESKSTSDDSTTHGSVTKRFSKDFWISMPISLILSFLLAGFALPQMINSWADNTLGAFLFPYALWLHYLTESTIVPLIMMLIQVPFYLLLLQLAASRARMFIRITVLHTIFTITCAILYDALR
jgi:hypothetical protein